MGKEHAELHKEPKKLKDKCLSIGVEVCEIDIDDLPKSDIIENKEWYIHIPNEKTFNTIYDKLVSLGWKPDFKEYKPHMGWFVLFSEVYDNGFVGWDNIYDNPLTYNGIDDLKIVYIVDKIRADTEYCSCEDTSGVVESSTLMEIFLYCRNCKNERLDL